MRNLRSNKNSEHLENNYVELQNNLVTENCLGTEDSPVSSAMISLTVPPLVKV